LIRFAHHLVQQTEHPKRSNFASLITDHEQVEIARRARCRRDLLLLVVEHRLIRQRKPIAAPGAAAFRSIVRRKIRQSGLTDRSQAGLRHDVYRFVVKGSAPELFPVMSLVRIWFTRRETEERRAFDRAGAVCYKALKALDIYS
jgi:hypothetical protein